MSSEADSNLVASRKISTADRLKSTESRKERGQSPSTNNRSPSREGASNTTSSSRKQRDESPSQAESRPGSGAVLTRERTISPGKAAKESTDPLYKDAMGKLVTAASKFNRETTAGILFMKSMENRELDASGFRESLRSGMNCRLSQMEFDTLMPHFENDSKPGFINGCDFILLFYRIRFEYRGELLTERIRKEAQFRAKDKEFLEKRRAEIANKNKIKVSFKFLEKHRRDALEKVRVAAFKYDKGAPGAPDLSGFDCMYLTPDAFKEVLRRTFNLKFTPEEFGAFLTEVADNEDPDKKVHCASFLVYFLRKGFLEREKVLKEQWARKDKIDAERRAYEVSKLEEQEGKNKQKVSKFTEQDKESALLKLRESAKYYDKSMPGAMSMKNFDMAYMEPHVFREQLKRVFNLRVTSAEMGAIISIFDEAGTGLIPCQEFAKTFLAMGFAERAARDRANLEKQREAETQMKVDAMEKLQALENKAKLDMKTSDKDDAGYSDKDFSSAMEKMKHAAWKFDKGAPGAPNLEAFDMKSMEPHVFREQLRRAFNLDLSIFELSALMTEYDPDATGLIACQDFLRKFLRQGINLRDEKEKRWRELQRKNEEKAKKAAIEKLEKVASKKLLQLGPFSQTDYDNAMEKITIGATKYHKAPSDVLDAFEAKRLPAHLFQSQLKMAFNVDINTRELAALMSVYDSDNKGGVHCKDFLNEFLKIGYDERGKIEDSWREERLLKQKRDEAYWANKEEEKALKQLAEVDFDGFTEVDFNEALRKFVHVCHAFEMRQLGPAGWSGFTAASLSPAEFREMMKRTFGLVVTPKELGALVTYFQKDVNATGAMSRTVNCQYFLNCFVQGRVKTEALKGKPDEKELMLDYQEELKEAYRVKKERTGDSLNARRPWRATATARKGPAAGSATVTRQILPYPETPTQKISRRLIASKKSGKLDLATKVKWPEGTDSAGLVQLGVEKKAPHGVRRKRAVMGGSAAPGKSLKDRSDNVAQYAKDAVNSSEGDARLKADFKLLNVPSEIWKIEQLEELWLCNNGLGGIPGEISKLVNLQVVGFTNNDLSTLPIAVCDLPKLRRLIAPKNRICELPEEFVCLTKLLELDLSENRFSEFPTPLLELPQMQIIRMSNQNPGIKYLPLELKNMRSLTILDLDKNPISSGTSPPEALRTMYSLKVIGLPVSSQVKTYSVKWVIHEAEEEELLGLLASKAEGAKRRAAAKKRIML